MLQLILGTSGSGKTYKIREAILEKVNSTSKPIMLIVPEQNSFQNEKEMIKLLGIGKCSRVNVMSFTRLVDLVFRKEGGLLGTRLNDGGRKILMSLALEDINDKLNLYKKAEATKNMVDIMISALKEFKMCTIDTEKLLVLSDSVDDELLKNKLQETALILETYDALMSQDYIDPLDDLNWLEKKVGEANFFEDYLVFIDGFNGFTLQELNVLGHIMEQSLECYISICTDRLDGKDNDMSLFSPVYKSVNRVIRLAKEKCVKIKPPVILYGQKRFKNDELRALEEFSYRQQYEPFDNKNIENIFIYNATDLYSEAEFVSNTIKRMVIEDGYKYRDFAVIARMSDTYRGIIDIAFENNGIPYFMDKPQKITSKPIIKFVLSAFEIIHSSYSTDSILKYLKTGLTDLTIEDISLIENYVFIWNITGKQWLKEFKANPSGFSEEFSDKDKNLLDRINNIRKAIIDPLSAFYNNLKGGTGEDYSKEIFFLLEKMHVYKNIVNSYEKLKENTNVILAQEQLRLWELLMSILDQMAMVLKKRYISSRRYEELLKLIIDSNDIAFIPQGIDEVTIGDADRIKLDSPKVVFLIGAVDGEFPRSPVSSGVFNDAERKKLLSLGVPMYSSLERLVVEERFLAYCSLSAPSEKLFISWPSSDIKGTSKLPSSILTEVRKLMPQITIYDEFSYYVSLEDRIWSEKSAFDLCSRYYREDSVFSHSLRHYFSSKEAYKNKLVAINRAIDNSELSFNDSTYSKALFGDNIELSASQIENFYLCKFQYFCKYGLKAKERKKAEFDALEYGNVVHYILENMLKKYNKREFCALSCEEIKSVVKDLLTQYLDMKLGGLDDKTSRFKYLYFRLIKSLQTLILHIARELMQSEFEPEDYELEIGKDIKPLTLNLADGSLVSVKGKVDRLDILRKDGKAYIRIIDYKTGSKDFKLSDVLYGLNMQMLIYLFTVWKNGESKYGKNIVPSGILYMPSTVKTIEADKNTPVNKLNKERDKIFKMNGLVLDDPIVIKAMEEDAKGIFIPVALKDGKPSKSESIANLKELGVISKYIETLIIEMAKSLKSGNITASPTGGEYDACRWCRYSSVCGDKNKNNKKEIKKIKREEVLKEMEETEYASKEVD